MTLLLQDNIEARKHSDAVKAAYGHLYINLCTSRRVSAGPMSKAVFPSGLQRIISLDASTDPPIMPPALAKEVHHRHLQSSQSYPHAAQTSVSFTDSDWSSASLQLEHACHDFNHLTYSSIRLEEPKHLVGESKENKVFGREGPKQAKPPRIANKGL